VRVLESWRGWASENVMREAAKLSLDDARAALGACGIALE
jgi:hypothetical protein